MNAPEEAVPRYTIRVTAGRDLTEAIAAKGAIYGDGEPAVVLIDQLTPFDIATSGRTLVGMVQAVDAGSRVMVDVISEDAPEPKLMMRAAGRTVLLGDNMRPATSLFVRTAR